MKFNILYLAWIALLGAAFYLGNQFIKTSETTVFGSAESDGQILNSGNAVLVKKILVRAGQPVRRGDTLLLLDRPELHKASVLKQTEQSQNLAERSLGLKNADSELEKLRADHQSRMAELETQLELLLKEEKTQAEMQKLVGSPSGAGKGILTEKISGTRQAIQAERERFAAQSAAIGQQRNAESGVHDTRLGTVQAELDILQQDKSGLTLRAPMDGYIESVYVFENEVASAFKPLLKINPTRPNKIKGFLPETTEVLFHLGDSVELISMTRPEISCFGVLTGSSASVTELPLRLRRFQNLSSWGREIYVDLPDRNEFFIGEKTLILLRDRGGMPRSAAPERAFAGQK